MVIPVNVASAYKSIAQTMVSTAASKRSKNLPLGSLTEMGLQAAYA